MTRLEQFLDGLGARVQQHAHSHSPLLALEISLEILWLQGIGLLDRGSSFGDGQRLDR